MKHERINCGYGPEDIGLESNQSFNRIIISCTKRKRKKRLEGGIWYYDFNKDNQAVKFTIQGYNEKDIKPHGISVLNRKNGSDLYVISHENYDKILKFEIKKDQIIFIREWTGKQYTFFDAINDLFVTPDEKIYVTVPGKPKLKKKPGSVYLIRPDDKAEELINDTCYPNGILVNDNKLYVAAFREDTLYQYHVNKDGTVDLNSKPNTAHIKSGDNITLSGDELIIANHPSKFKFILHAIFKTKSPSSVYSYNIKSKKMDQLFCDNGKEISGSSTAIRINDELYISQVFDNFLLKVNLNNYKYKPCN